MGESSKSSEAVPANAKNGPGILHFLAMAVLALMLIGSLTALALAYAAQSVALNPSFYKSELERAGVYDYAYQKLSESLKEQGGTQAEAMQKFSGIKIEDVVTRAWIKTQAEGLIDHAFAYFDGQSASAELYIDLTEPKSRLYAKAQERIAQLPQGAQAAATTSLEGYKQEFDQKIPDRVDLAAQAGGAQGLEQVKNGVQSIRTVTLVFMGLSLLWAGLIAYLNRKRLPSMARWLGASLLIAGALTWLALSVMQGKVTDALSAYASVDQAAIFLKLASDTAQAFNDAATPLALALIVVGAIGIVASFLLPKAQPQAAKAKAEKAKEEKAIEKSKR